MGQKFDENGTVVPVTKVVAGPCVVTQVKADKADGYAAVQVGYGARKYPNKALSGHLKGLTPAAFIKEFRLILPKRRKSSSAVIQLQQWYLKKETKSL